MCESIPSLDGRLASLSRRALPLILGTTLAVNLLPGCGLGKDKKDTTPNRDPDGLAFQTSGEGSKEFNMIIVPPNSYEKDSEGRATPHKLLIKFVMDCASTKENDFVSASIEGIVGAISAHECDTDAGGTYIIPPEDAVYDENIVPINIVTSRPSVHWDLSAETRP